MDKHIVLLLIDYIATDFRSTGGIGEECVRYHCRLSELLAVKKDHLDQLDQYKSSSQNYFYFKRILISPRIIKIKAILQIIFLSIICIFIFSVYIMYIISMLCDY